MSDLIDRQAAIDAIEHITSSMSVCINSDECHGMKRMQRQAVIELANLSSAEPHDCNTCRYNNLKWHEEPCDSCTGGGKSNHWKPPVQQQWIPCSERLPEEVGYYLVTLARDSEVDIAYFTKYHTWETFRNTEVIAWADLPNPYKEIEYDDIPMEYFENGGI